MGTRHLYVVFCKGRFRIARCGFGYIREIEGPDGIARLKAEIEEDAFNYAANKQAELDEAGLEQVFEQTGLDDTRWASEVEKEVLKELSFVASDMHCEWAYVVHLDLSVFEVWAGQFHTGRDTTQTRFDSVVAAYLEEEPYDQFWDGEPGTVVKYALNQLPMKSQFRRIAGTVKKAEAETWKEQHV